MTFEQFLSLKNKWSSASLMEMIELLNEVGEALEFSEQMLVKTHGFVRFLTDRFDGNLDELVKEFEAIHENDKK